MTMELIDKSAVVAEIERRRRDWWFGSSTEAKFKREECDDILSLLDTFEVKDDMDTIHPIEDVVSNDPLANSYKEKYEQALKVAKETYDKQPMYRDWLERMFPELAESEDEKVGKELIKHLKELSDWKEDEVIPVKNPSYYRQWASWLEKQGEQKPSDEEMKTLLRTEYEKGRVDAIAEMQKEWSEEDEVKINRIVACLENLNVADNDILLKDVEWLKSLRPQNRWKPSDEQMEALNYVVNLMASSESPKENDYYYNVFNDLRKQLKKLKEE